MGFGLFVQQGQQSRPHGAMLLVQQTHVRFQDQKFEMTALLCRLYSSRLPGTQMAGMTDKIPGDARGGGGGGSSSECTFTTVALCNNSSTPASKHRILAARIVMTIRTTESQNGGNARAKPLSTCKPICRQVTIQTFKRTWMKNSCDHHKGPASCRACRCSLQCREEQGLTVSGSCAESSKGRAERW